jgi:putative PIN family toxin of toxin-antitoxin system
LEIKNFLIEQMLFQSYYKITFTEFTDIYFKTRDEKDNMVLKAALEHNIDYLVTGDKDLLELKEIKNTKIILLSQLFAVND